MRKICSKCLVEKDLNDFRKEKSRKDGHKAICRACCKSYGNDHYHNNKKMYADNNKKWMSDNKVKRLNYVKELQKYRYENDLQFKITHSLRTRLGSAIRNHKTKKIKSTFQLLGCDIEFFLKYIESKFTEGMSWENYGRSGWHIDHIIPCDMFDLTVKENQEKCFHYTNLQPLWATVNTSKGARYIG
jgi:hypothetical protein